MRSATSAVYRAGSAAGAQEREQLQPVAALIEVEVGHQHSRPVAGRLDQDAAVRIGDERQAVEPKRRLVTDPVHRHHECAVRNPVADCPEQHIAPRPASASTPASGTAKPAGIIRVSAATPTAIAPPSSKAYTTSGIHHERHKEHPAAHRRGRPADLQPAQLCRGQRARQRAADSGPGAPPLPLHFAGESNDRVCLQRNSRAPPAAPQPTGAAPIRAATAEAAATARQIRG